MSIVKSQSLPRLKNMDRKRDRPSSDEMMLDDRTDLSQNPRKKDSATFVGVAALEKLPLVPISPEIVQVSDSITSSNDDLQKWMRHVSEHGESVRAQLLQVRDTVQKYYRDNIADHENSVEPLLLNQLNEERSKLCQMVVVSCREIEALRNQLIHQASVSEMTAQERQAMVAHTQRVFSVAQGAQQKYAQMESMFYNVANHILLLQQERDVQVQENIHLKASMRALDFHRSQEVAGVTSQLEQQTAELNSMKAQHAKDSAFLTKALKDMERQYGDRIQQLDAGMAKDRAKAEAHIVQLKSEASHAMQLKDAQIQAQDDQLKAEQFSVKGLKSELSSVMSNLSAMQHSMVEQKAEFSHHLAEMSAADTQMLLEKSLTNITPDIKSMNIPLFDPYLSNSIVESSTATLLPGVTSSLVKPLTAEGIRIQSEALTRDLAAKTSAGASSSQQTAPASKDSAGAKDSTKGVKAPGKSKPAGKAGGDSGGNKDEDEDEDR